MTIDWMYNEYRHCGVDYADKTNADAYDEQHTTFRDYGKEFTEMLSFLEIPDPSAMTLLDLGCGTGALAFHAARHFGHVHCVDVSEQMLSQLRVKVAGANLDNITIRQGGFLGYQHDAESVDLLVSKYAFHHLPDFWKQVALRNIHSMIKPGGSFYLADVIFDFPAEEYRERFDAWIAWFTKATGEKFAQEAATHLRDEYSTFSWIMNGMLERAGFSIKKRHCADGFSMQYHCIRN